MYIGCLRTVITHFGIISLLSCITVLRSFLSSLPTRVSHSVTSCIAYASSHHWPDEGHKTLAGSLDATEWHTVRTGSDPSHGELGLVPVATRVAREVFYQFNLLIIESNLIGPDLDPAVTPSLVVLSQLHLNFNWTIQFAGWLSRKNSWSLCTHVSGSCSRGSPMYFLLTFWIVLLTVISLGPSLPEASSCLRKVYVCRWAKKVGEQRKFE